MTKRQLPPPEALLAAAAGLVASALAFPPPAPAAPPAGAVLRDVPYVAGGHERQRLDLYLPTVGEGPFPVIVWVHGGAWRGGDKSNTPARRLTVQGYAVASVNYRLSDQAKFPAQLEDCKAAVRWLRAKAAEHQLDPDRFGAWGSSAGGHLVALLGTTGDTSTFDTGDHLDQPSRVQAVVDFFGPTDFLRMNTQAGPGGVIDHDSPGSPESQLLGGPVQDNADAARRADPVTYAGSGDAPFLIVHGDSDRLVPHGQSELLRDALEQAGVPVDLYTVEGGGHGGFRDPAIGGLVDAFLEKHLGAVPGERATGAGEEQ